MVRTKARQNRKGNGVLKTILFGATCVTLGFFLGTAFNSSFLPPPPPSSSSSSLSLASSAKEFQAMKAKSVAAHTAAMEIAVDETCQNIPTIRPSGAYFLDTRFLDCPSLEGISPSFNIASVIGPKVKYHMGMDVANFQLMKELFESNSKGSKFGHKNKSTLTLDIGANQGFYTYYLATLGMEVHSFEIFEENFKALQHGAEFNPKEISDRINLYPIGLGEKNGRFGMKGKYYEGFLKEQKDGPILGLSMDCFVHRASQQRDWSNLAFVKLDVEGFEISVLRGAHNSLLSDRTHIGGMVMEVGPSRWDRAGVDFSTGVEEMRKLASKFQTSYVLIRTSGSYKGTCPSALAQKTLKDKNPRIMDNVSVFKVAMEEWEPLLAELNKIKGDCNFFYQNTRTKKRLK